MRKTYLRGAMALLCVCAACHPGQAQPSPGTSNAAGPAWRSAVDELLRPAAGRAAPGCAVGVYQDGQIVHARGYGDAAIEFGVPIAPDTSFNAGSMAKQFTAFAVLLLVEEGKVALDGDVRVYLPELPDYARQYGRPVTVRQLLQQTSGIRDFDILRQLAGAHADDVFEQEAALRLISRQQALNFAPGARWSYSNSGYVLAAEIVRRVSGKGLPDFLQERVFGPLGMHSTRIARSHDEYVPRRALGYRSQGSVLQLWMPDASTIGDGALFTTVSDLARWDANVDRPGIGANALKQMMEPGTLRSGTGLEYGMGMFVGSFRGHRTVYNPGSFGGYLGNYLRLPSLRLGISILCNSRKTDPVSLSRRVAAAVLGDRLPAPPPNVRPAPAPPAPAGEIRAGAIAGRYGSAADNVVISFRSSNGALFMEEGEQRLLLRAQADGTFAAGAGNEMRRFRFDPAGRAASLAVSELLSDAAGDEIRLRRLPIPPGRTELGAYPGSYYSADLDARFVIVLDSEGLAARWPNGNLTPLIPFQRNQFGRKGIVFTFSGSRMVIDAPRAEGIEFSRTPASGHQASLPIQSSSSS